jgi:hypothetical protein
MPAQQLTREVPVEKQEVSNRPDSAFSIWSGSQNAGLPKYLYQHVCTGSLADISLASVHGRLALKSGTTRAKFRSFGDGRCELA